MAAFSCSPLLVNHLGDSAREYQREKEGEKQRQIEERWIERIRVEDYAPGKKISLKNGKIKKERVEKWNDVSRAKKYLSLAFADQPFYHIDDTHPMLMKA